MTGGAPGTVLAIDPGRTKCGLAVITRSAGGMKVLHQGVIETSSLRDTVEQLTRQFGPDMIAVGNGTTSAAAVLALDGPELPPIELVDERFTTVLARRRFFVENPPRGLRRLIPISLQTPGRPYDDYVAVLLAERYLDRGLG